MEKKFQSLWQPGHLVGLMMLAVSLPLLVWQTNDTNQILLAQPAFLALHSMMETFAVIVAALIFFTAYGSHPAMRSLRSVLVACAFMAVTIFDTMHFLSYIGMPDLMSVNTPHKAILFWLAGRSLAAFGLLAYILLPESRLSQDSLSRYILSISFVVVVVVAYLMAAYPEDFPITFVPGQGLTEIKIVSEWLLFGVYVGSATLLYFRRNVIANSDISSLLIALLLLSAGELFFTMYTHVSNTANFLGHVYKVVAYYYLYRAFYYEVVRRPFIQIEEMLSHDELTGLYSRSAFNRQLQIAITHTNHPSTACSVILLGLDHFKNVNATLGHEKGDLLLIAVAARITENLPDSSFVARFSGDNFVILLTGDSVLHSYEIGQRLLTTLHTVFRLGQDHIEIGASIGIVKYPDDGDSPSVLIRHADLALHQAKAEGRNCQVVFSHDLSDKIQRRSLIESNLRHALQRNELSLHYQPKVDLASGNIDGWEALLRWQSQELGPVSPMEFIPVAEETGLILPIGEWVLRHACTQVALWQAMGLASGSVAVNLSARQFRQNDLVEIVQRILYETGLPANLLELEITESIIMYNINSAENIIKKLRDIGVRIALDDFGTGYSSLSYLKTFSIHSLKVDRSFIRDIPDNEDDAVIVRSILSLGHSLGLRVVAEGVETEEQLAYLRNEACDEIQGYLFSRPLPAAECEKLLQAGKKL